MDLSISCCRLIFTAFFFFVGIAGSAVVAAGGVAAGSVAGAGVVAAVGGVAAGAVAGAGAVVAAGGVAAGSVAGAGAVVVACAGAAVVPVSVFGVLWANTTPAGTQTNSAAAAAIRESSCIQFSSIVPQARPSGRDDLTPCRAGGRPDQRTSSVTASGTKNDVTSALRLMAMPANTPATAST
jgi:hypothetical protein